MWNCRPSPPKKNAQTCLLPCRGGASITRPRCLRLQWKINLPKFLSSTAMLLGMTRHERRKDILCCITSLITRSSCNFAFFGHSENTATVLQKFVMESLLSLDWMLVERWSQNQSRCELVTYLVICGYVNRSIVQALQLLGHQRHSEGCVIAGC